MYLTLVVVPKYLVITTDANEASKDAKGSVVKSPLVVSSVFAQSWSDCCHDTLSELKFLHILMGKKRLEYPKRIMMINRKHFCN